MKKTIALILLLLCVGVRCMAAESDVNVYNQEGLTPLMQAVFMGNIERVKQLLDKGADIKLHSKKGDTAIAIARDQDPFTPGYKDMLRTLITALVKVGTKEDINAPYKDGSTILMQVAFFGWSDVASELIEKGADVNAKSDTGYTALMYAAGKHTPDMVKLLIAKGADVNAAEKGKKLTALLIAARFGTLEMVQTLLDAGADINAVTIDGNGALAEAKMADSADIAKLLIARGAKVDRKNTTEKPKGI